MSLRQAAITHLESQAHYHDAFRDYFANQVTRLPIDRFWELQRVFRHDVCRYRFGYDRTNGVEQAARELFRKPYANDFTSYGETVPEYSVEEAVQFAKTWSELKSRLYARLFDVVDGRGDDAYGDLLDALPLAGREVVRKSVDGEFASNELFEQAVAEACQECQGLAELILHGENYCYSHLHDAARDYLALHLQESCPEETAWA